MITSSWSTGGEYHSPKEREILVQNAHSIQQDGGGSTARDSATFSLLDRSVLE